MKGIIYYTDNKLDQLKSDYMLNDLVRQHIKDSNLPIVSVSQKPIDFGENITLPLESNAVSMVKQIIVALLASKEKYVFFCEHDVIYHPSHFEFTPPRDDTFYYNTNVWRCHPRRNICVTYDELRSLSGMCVNRELALEHFIKRLDYIFKNGFHKELSRNPKWARIMGYEPGKSPRNGGFSNDKMDDWRSEYPNLDIRHRLTMTIPKLSIDQFNTPPKNWKQVTIDKVEGWDIKKLFQI
jgi:hypothetical protein